MNDLISNSAFPSIPDLLQDVQRHHSKLQLDSFVTVRSGMTLYGCYRQALRELATRVTSLRDLRHQLQMNRLKIERWRKTGDELKLEKARYLEESLTDTEGAIREIQGEQDRFYAQAVALRQTLETEGVKFPLDRETKDRLDRDFWLHVLKATAAVEIIATNAIGRSTVELFRALPPDMKRELAVILDVKQRQAICDWFLNFETPMPVVPGIEGLEGRLKVATC